MGNKKLIEQEYGTLLSRYPKLLQPVYEYGIWRIDGSIDVIDDEGGYWDTYQVSIFFPPDYPANIPQLRETSEKIKRHEDWHMSEKGFCCLATRAKIFYDLANGITLLKWLDQFAHPFLANHVYRVKTGQYAHEEFNHGTKGIIEGWQKILRIQNPSQILEHLRLVSGYRTQALNRPCFCGSGKKYKRCYEINPGLHRLHIPCKEIEKDVISIRKYLSKF